MSSDLERALRRLKPEKHHQQLRSRRDAELTFIDSSPNPPRSLLYDTTVYVDMLQGRFPDKAEPMLRAADAWHSTVAEAELAATCGLLHPAHPNTKEVIQQITDLVDRIPPYRCLAPDRGIWFEAGILAGTLSRLLRIPKPDRRQILNDALIFATARKYGHTVLTRNSADFDFLNQLDPSGRVVFYRV